MASKFRALTEEELGFVGGGVEIVVRGSRLTRWDFDNLFGGGGWGTGSDSRGGGDEPPPPSDETFCDNETAPEDDPDVDPAQKQAFDDHLAQLTAQLKTMNPDSVFTGQVTINGQNFEISFSAGEFLAILEGYEFVFSDSMTSPTGAGGSFDDFAVVDPDLLALINSPMVQGENINAVIADWLIVHEVGHQLRAVESLTNGQFQQWYDTNSSSLAGLSQEQITEQWRQTDTFAQLESMNNTVGRAILGESGISNFWGSPGKGYSTTLTLTVTVQPGAGEAGEQIANECGGADGGTAPTGGTTSGGTSGGSTSGGTSGSGGGTTSGGSGGGGGTMDPNLNLY